MANSSSRVSSSSFLSHPLNIVVTGTGAREHTLAWKLSQSSHCASITIIPGNDGMKMLGFQCVKPKSPSITDLIQAITQQNPDFVVIGPDDHLAAGIVDKLTAQGIVCFGPTKAAAQIETSKSFAKKVMNQAKVATAASFTWSSHKQAQDELQNAVAEFGGYPIVLKYDGLALGKGVQICTDENTATAFIKEVFEDKKFNAQTPPLLVAEEMLIGHEVSVFALCDGESAYVLGAACDHKRLQDGNRGPNTGGMGAYSPVPWFGNDRLAKLKDQVFAPVLSVLKEQGAPFKGLLYAGLMVNGQDIKVLEFNARFGDPETQVLLPRMDFDLLPMLYAAALGDISLGVERTSVKWKEGAAVGVVLASDGYPQAPIIGKKIHFNQAQAKDAMLFFAGVAFDDSAAVNSTPAYLVTGGGRVITLTCLGPTLELARGRCYAALDSVLFENRVYRTDVGSFYG